MDFIKLDGGGSIGEIDDRSGNGVNGICTNDIGGADARDIMNRVVVSILTNGDIMIGWMDRIGTARIAP